MKTPFYLLLLCSFHATKTAAQKANEGCPFLREPKFNVFIPGYRDTIQSNGLKARFIDARILTQGFELNSSDSLLHLKSFQLVFDDKHGNLYSKMTIGSKMLAEESEMFSLKKISHATIITIDNITVEYKGKCYVIPGQVYYAR